ncbi:hypothetical protein BGW80DRAFT_1282159 [Lactifluus volemus]|nr:hypothetical protein BGW80DRAFT_1282159 [Lactifluus volemus]
MTLQAIPLIVLYAPGMLPSTCILTSQRERSDAKRREKQRAFAEAMRGGPSSPGLIVAELRLWGAETLTLLVCVGSYRSQRGVPLSGAGRGLKGI